MIIVVETQEYGDRDMASEQTKRKHVPQFKTRLSFYSSANGRDRDYFVSVKSVHVDGEVNATHEITPQDAIKMMEVATAVLKKTTKKK